MTDLPAGWARYRISEALDSTIGGVWGVPPGEEVIDVDVIRVTELRGNGLLEPSTAARRSVTLAQLQSRMLEPGDLLLEKSGGGPNTPVGRVGMVERINGPTVCSNFMQLMRPNRDVISPRFLMWQLVNAHLTGVTAALQSATTNIRNLKMKDYWGTELPLPPLAEQERILTAIEESFSKLGAGEAGLRKVRQLLKRLREAVLAAAVTGSLVPQDPSDIPATKLLADHGASPLDEVALAPLPDAWSWARVGDLLTKPLSNGRSVRSLPGGFPVLRLTCLRDGRIDLSERKDGEWSAVEAAPFLVHRGDFLVSRGNGSLNLVGRGGLVDVDPDAVAYPDTLIRLHVSSEVLTPSLLAIWWNASVVRSQLEARTRTTAGIYKVNQSMIADVRLPIPAEVEQARIVAEVDRQFSFIDACERAVDAGLARSAALRRSVLKSAFGGRLVPQDPSEEPASMLLERIRAERASNTGETRGRRRKNVEAT
jgi:restriction endonuclease S subunit